MNKEHVRVLVVDSVYCVLRMLAVMNEDISGKEAIQAMLEDMHPADQKDSTISANSIALAPKVLEAIEKNLDNGFSPARAYNLSLAWDTYRKTIKEALKE